jgi:hypothetical protein
MQKGKGAAVWASSRKDGKGFIESETKNSLSMSYISKKRDEPRIFQNV